MKTIYTVWIVMLSFIVTAQSESVVGNYAVKLGTADFFEYKLNLNEDGTFFFHYYSNIRQGIPPEVTKYGKGKWTVDKNVVTFVTDKQNIDAKHTLDFSITKARFIFKSPRDKSDRIIQTKLKFLESSLPWMYNIEMLKI